MDTFLRGVRGINRALHYVSGALIALMMLFTVYNIAGRWLFGAPLRGTVELTQLSMIAIVYLGFAYAQHQDDHITVDVLYVRFGKRGRAVIDAVAALISFAVLVLIAWRLHAYSETLLAGGRTTATRRIPLHPLAYVAIAGMVAFALALVTTVIERAREARRSGAPGGVAGDGDGEQEG